MPKPSGKKTALDLARALRRYGRMKPWNACAALWKEWPKEIAKLIDVHLWSEIKAKTLPEMAREIHAGMSKVEGASKAVAQVKARERAAWLHPAMPKKSALDLAQALRRYDRMKPENAYTALHKEWPSEIAKIIDVHMWAEVQMRPVAEIEGELHALMCKAEAASRAMHEAKAA